MEVFRKIKERLTRNKRNVFIPIFCSHYGKMFEKSDRRVVIKMSGGFPDCLTRSWVAQGLKSCRKCPLFKKCREESLDNKGIMEINI